MIGGFVVVGIDYAQFFADRDTANVAVTADWNEVKQSVIDGGSISIWNALGISSWPTLTLLAPSGRVLALWCGERQEDGMNAMVAAALQYHADKIDHKPLLLA